MNLSAAVDTISLAQPIRDGETLVSASQSFELGFFTPGNSNNRYLGIWYKFNHSTVVWVANRKNPITDKQGMLVMRDDGNLVLLSKDKKIIWSTNSSRVLENPVGQLLDSGNLVIRDNINMSSDGYVWQSFDYPSDTFLPGMKLGWNLRTGFERYLTPWRSADDPSSSGDFSFRLDIHGLPQIVITTGSRKEVRSGPWNGRQFLGIPTLHNSVFKPMLVHNQDELYYTYEPFNNTVKTFVVLLQSGAIHRFVWNWQTTEWSILFTWPFDQCDNYAQCGANNYCRINKTPICECLKGFIPKAEDEWHTQGLSQSRKCIKNLPSDCPSGEGFLKLPAIKLPDFYRYNNSMNIKECEAECFKNCSCRAYANSDVSGGSGCLMWFGDLIDIRECPPGFIWGQDFFLRVPASELDRPEMSSVVFMLANEGLLLPQPKQPGFFTERGFIPVAIKVLAKSKFSGEEFINEVSTIGRIHHTNVVRLLGFCYEGSKHSLVYEYMPNGSLDRHIFSKKEVSRNRILWLGFQLPDTQCAHNYFDGDCDRGKGGSSVNTGKSQEGMASSVGSSHGGAIVEKAEDGACGIAKTEGRTNTGGSHFKIEVG
ncbi:hypothetical protein EZV62_008385 [Acer yangbiense]|uniref:Receptor-like serine/threonine-protein kinase n=1 Tax=Acer yangbiense TaxID=1000413 RepID=A0A5C7ICN2_9ROSI|nr:hypothetical protein EZV62_008385 [Acer yangbiense]